MKYRTTGTRLGHKLFVRNRETAFDKKRNSLINNDSILDHSKMKGHEFAAFQKKIFLQKKKDRKRRKMILLISVVLTILIVIGFLIFWNTYDFSLLKSSEF